jgi:GT2 family glycosyltransferase
MRVAIVILHFINKKLTSQCLESIKKLNTKDLILNTLIVNNNPTEALDDLEKKFKDFVFLKAGKNLGFAGGNNVGIKEALKESADFVFIVNNDTILDKNLLVQLVKVASLNGKSGILGPKIYFAPGYEFHKQRYKPEDQGKVIWYAGGIIDWQNVLASHRGVDEVDKGQYDQQVETDFASGCAMMVGKEVFEKIGLLDEKYFLYWEDVDFCQRAKRVGFKVVYAPQAKLWHANAGSSVVGGPLQDYYLTRNRMFFGLKYAPWWTKTALIRESTRIFLTGRKWQKIGIKDFYLRKFGKGSWKDQEVVR